MNNNETPQTEIRQQAAHDEISHRAEELWRQCGCPQGRDEAIWLEAERQVLETSSNLRSPASEGVGTSQSATENSTPVSPRAKSSEYEMMEFKKSPATKAGRSKSRQGGK